jgi:hypothetical protein
MYLINVAFNTAGYTAGTQHLCVVATYEHTVERCAWGSCSSGPEGTRLLESYEVQTGK